MGSDRRVSNPRCCFEVARDSFVVDERGDVHPGGLSPIIREWLAWGIEWADRREMARPEILSGCRPLWRQQQMQALWDQGHRAGLAVRPADNSKHIPDAYGMCRAVDLANEPGWLYVFGPATTREWGHLIEWGGTYIPRDPRHFEER